MRSRILLKQTFILLVVLFGLNLFSAPVVNDVEVIENQEQVNSGLPSRLRIPSINVDTTIEYVGLTTDDLMDSPEDPDTVGWFELGARPGEVGSAVIDGHSGWKNNIPAVFDNLNKLKIGDKVYVEDEVGLVITFVVREIRIYRPDADATEVFSSTDGEVHLNLITCTGTWDNIKRSSSGRLVVFTDKE